MASPLIRTNDDPVALIMRLVLGIVFFPHGAQKVLGWFGGHGVSATLDAMTKQGLPAFLVILIMVAEFGGSIGLILGFLTRLAALGVGCVMLGAILMVHGKIGFFMNWFGNQKGEGYEYHLLALGLVVALLIKGGGLLSVDRALSGGDARVSTARYG
ncbi:MAG: DoxX family protein [Myxococcales bacterium]